MVTSYLVSYKISQSSETHMKIRKFTKLLLKANIEYMLDEKATKVMEATGMHKIQSPNKFRADKCKSC